jgi:hypothetical protein
MILLRSGCSRTQLFWTGLGKHKNTHLKKSLKIMKIKENERHVSEFSRSPLNCVKPFRSLKMSNLLAVHNALFKPRIWSTSVAGAYITPPSSCATWRPCPPPASTPSCTAASTRRSGVGMIFLVATVCWLNANTGQHEGARSGILFMSGATPGK